ncbi:hypothetical protein ACQ5SA_17915 [Stenotrophomonas indicatrix]
MHDWTIIATHSDWIAATFELVLRDATQTERHLQFEAVEHVVLDRSEPWGPSASINEVMASEDRAEGGIRVVFELQSGGAVHISAGACRMDGEPFAF